LSVLAVNTQVARAIIRKPHVALWPKRLDTLALKQHHEMLGFVCRFALTKRLLSPVNSIQL